MNIDPNAYVRRPVTIVQAAKNNAYYIGRLKQHLDDFDKDLAEWKSSGEWKKDYKTWGAACEIALNMSRQHANRLISQHEESKSSLSAQTEHKCSAEADAAEAHESEMRMAMPELPEPELPEPPAVHTGPAPRPAPVAATAAPEPPKPPEPPKDKFGRVIPERCLPLVERAAGNLQPCISASSKLTGLFSALSNDLKHPDPLFAFAHGHIQEGLDHARWLHHLLRDCKPDLVCPACDGNGKKCDVCLNTGMVSEHTWSHRIIGSLSGDPKLADKAKAIEKGKL